jgi:hypothetical protein
MRLWLGIGLLFAASSAFADVSVVASVDRNHIAFGESVTLTISVQGTQDAAPSIPHADGLTFNGPSTQTRISIVNGQTSQSADFIYQVTPTRMGEFTVPSIGVTVSGKGYSTEPIQLHVEKGAIQADSSQSLFGKIDSPKQLYPGQVAPIDVYVAARQDLPLRQLSRPQIGDAEGFTCHLIGGDWQGEQQIISGQMFNIYRIHGAITASKPGEYALGPVVVRGGLEVEQRGGHGFDDLFSRMMGQIQLQEVRVAIDSVPVEVLPLPDEGRPADFAGAVGQWNLEVTAKPTDVAVGDPITLTIKVSGNGNIDTVPAPKLGAMDGFKTYDPTTKTTKDDLNTTGERVIQQVLIAKSTEVKELPEVRLVYFDPVAGSYKTDVQSPIKLVVKAGSGGQTTIVSSGLRLRPEEKLGQDIVYLKGDIGPVPPGAPVYRTAAFWALNVTPVLALLGTVGWKRRTDRLRGDVAYARRTRAAKKARRLLTSATSYDEIQRALQQYLGDRLNIPVGGITASVVDEQLLPRGVNGELAARAKACFEACDTARFAGEEADMSVQTTRDNVERLIDELESKHL